MGFIVWLSVSVQQQPFDLASEEALLRAQGGDAGALVSFQGMVRTHDATSPLKTLSIEHYPVFTENEIKKTVHHASQHWPIMACRIIHRVGKLLPGEAIVLVLVSTKHRHDAFRAASFLMNQLKTDIPFWKCEEWVDGSRHWVKPESSKTNQPITCNPI